MSRRVVFASGRILAVIGQLAAGDDFIAAGTGADIAHGGTGDDDLFSMNDADLLFGDEGDDFIVGGGLDSNDNARRISA
jgi:Ca2+-binding RTX toxin-like protein